MAELNTVFISYAREDEAAARDLYKRLVNAGLDPWLDREKLVGGEDWDRAIKRALKQSEFAVLCLSERSVAKRGYLQREFKMALDAMQEMLASDIYLLPVRLDRCQVPEELSHLQWINLYEAAGWQQMLAALQTGKARRASAAPAAESPAQTGATPGPGGVSVTRDVAEIGSLAPVLPRGITRPGRLRALLAGQAALSPWVFLLLGAVFLILGNALALAGRSAGFLRTVLDTQGFGGLRFLHAYHYLIAIVAVVLGGVFISAWLLNLFYRDRPVSRVRRLATAAAAAGALSLGNLLYGLIAETEFEPVVEAAVFERLPALYTRAERVWEDSGGFRTEYSPNSRTQPWSSAQLLTAILGDPSHRAEELLGSERLWASMEYLEATRSDAAGGGWGYWPGSGPTITEIIGWIVVAQSAALKHPPDSLFSATRHALLTQRVGRDVDVLIERQLQGRGAWGPVTTTREPRTYSTLMAVWALVEAASVLPPAQADRALAAARNGVEWLLENRDARFGWSPRPRPGRETERFPGLTAQVVYVLARALEHKPLAFIRTDPGFDEMVDFVLALRLEPHDDINTLDARTPDTDVHLADSEFVLEGSTFLMYPWAVASLADIERSQSIDAARRTRAAHRRLDLLLRWDDIDAYVTGGYPYMLAETLAAVASSMPAEH